jgi:hypothetical protein
MGKTDIKVKELVSLIKNGDLRLPEMQRRYVWKSTRVRDLLDSLYRGYPSGSILVWETDMEQPTQEMSVSQKESPFAGHKLLLDGQQRLTSLTSIISGEPVTVRGKIKPIEIMFNLEHPESLYEYTEVSDDASSGSEVDDVEDIEDEEDDMNLQERLGHMTFVVASRSLAQQKNWIQVSKVFNGMSDAEILKSAGVVSFEDNRYEKYSQRIQKLRSILDYTYNMHVLPKDMGYEEVTEIFVRVNSLGVKLRGSDLALAQITSRWNNSLKLLEEFQEECEEHWMTLDFGTLVRSMVVFATDQSRFNKVASIPISRFKEGWEKAKEGLRFAINFLKLNANIEDESLLSSPFFFIVIAYFGMLRNEKLTPEEVNKLKYWLYLANAKGRYSRGSSESILDVDLKILKQGGTADDLIRALDQQFGRLTFNVNDLIGRGVGSPLFSLLFIALKTKGAKDWYSSIQIALNPIGKSHSIQYHHIFPKSLLKNIYEKSEINEITNMAFIAGKTNQSISNKPPKVYLQSIINSNRAKTITDQYVPMDEDLFEISNYRAFLEKRRTMLIDMLNSFVEELIH